MTTAVLSEAAPWHAGELAMQRQVNVVELMDTVGRRAVHHQLVQQHQDFFPLLPFVVVGSVDDDGDVWATIKSGYPGFLHASDDMHLDVALARNEADPADAGMNVGRSIALLGIELPTRRRNRLNGVIEKVSSDHLTIRVEQSYGNCPKYIVQRIPAFVRDPSVAMEAPAVVSDALDDRARHLIETADTFFVASYIDQDGAKQIDVSHRGGQPGFVHIGHDDVLTIPDFAGNRFFNTLGNMLVNPRAGLVFIDFVSGDLLQMTGSSQIILDAPDIDSFPGAQRLWRFKPEKVVLRRDAIPLRFALQAAA